MDEKPLPLGREKLLRDYASANIDWHTLRERGFEDYIQVFSDLSELGLRPPIAPMEGPNREARERGRAVMRRALRGQLKQRCDDV